ncbi:MAG: hypothetical protein AABM41_05995 [Chloroflexota bacterium]
MNRLSRIALAASLSLGMLSMPTMALAATDVTYALRGSEIAATEFTGVFVGVAVATDDYGTWQATIDHDSVPTKKNKSAEVTGGSFAFDGELRDLAGTFDPGGSITLETDVQPCGKQTYRVVGDLTLTGPTAGTADFEAVVTHHRIFLWGHCITYAATVKGSVTFHLTT